MKPIPGLAVGTRFFGKNPAKDLPRIESFIHAAVKVGSVYVAVRTEADTIGSLTFAKKNFPVVDAFSVTPWGERDFALPLNVIVSRAVKDGASRLLPASAEFPPQHHQVEQLLAHVGDDTLVAGARFSEHEFDEGERIGTGTTVPWNTFSIWNLDYLGRCGFPLVGDAPFDPKMAGVEEVTTIALYQQLGHPITPEAKLVSIEGFFKEWNMDGWDQDRIDRHLAKIASKKGRPAAQLAWAKFHLPRVTHIA